MSFTTERDWKIEAPSNENDVNKNEPSIYGGVIGKASFSPSNLKEEATPNASNATKEASSKDNSMKRRGPSTKNAVSMKTSSIQNHKKRPDRSFTDKKVKIDQLFTGNAINAHDHPSEPVVKTEDSSNDTKIQPHSSPALGNKRDLSRQLETAPGLPNLQDNVTSEKDNATSIKDSVTSKKDNFTSKKDIVTSKKDNFTSIKDNATSKKDTITSIESSGWSVCDASLAIKGEYALMFTDVRPSFVTIAGTRWQEGTLLHFLNKLSQVECPVYLTPRDTLWKPGEEGKNTSRARIVALLPEDHKCDLVFVWGALDLPTLRSLPKSVKNVGIAMATTGDMQLVYELDRWGHQLEFIHLSFLKSFKNRHWGNRVFKPKSASSVCTCLHFPNLHSDDQEWMKSIVSAVVPRDDQKSCVWGLYLPGTSLSSDALMNLVISVGLQCKVFLPASRALEGGERKKVLKKYKRHKCSVEWILETI